MKDLNNLTDEEIKNNYGENEYVSKNKKYRWTIILGYTGSDDILANVLESDFWNEEEKESIRRLVGKNEKIIFKFAIGNLYFYAYGKIHHSKSYFLADSCSLVLYF